MNCLLIAYCMNGSRGRGSRRKELFLFELLVAVGISAHQGGRREMLGCWVLWWGTARLVRVRVFHFVMCCLFSFLGWFFTGGLVPFTQIYYFSHRGSWWIRKISASEFTLVCAWACEASVCVCACACARTHACEGATLSWLFQISLPHSSTGRGHQEGERGRDGEIIRMEGERRLTQSLMSFPCFLCLFLGQGPLAEDVGGLRTIEQTEPRSTGIDFYIKESSPT